MEVKNSAAKEKITLVGRLSSVFVEQFQLTILVILLITSIGLVGVFSLPKESLPEIIFPAITVQTLFPGAAPEDVELLVTEVIENKIKDFDDIDTIESETGSGISVITVTYLAEVAIDQKKIELDNALREINFAEGVLDPEAFIFSTSEIPLMTVSVAGDYDMVDLTRYAEAIQSEIESVPGVDEVEINGDVVEEVTILVDELKMMTYGISFSDIDNAIGITSFEAPVGTLELGGTRYNLRVDEAYASIRDIEDTYIQEGVYVKDVADVIDGLEPVDSYSRTFIRGIDEAALPSLFLTVNRKVNSDVIGTSNLIKGKLSDGKGNLFPEDLTVFIANDQAVSVTSDLDKIQSSAWSGLIVVVLVLFLFIGFKESLIVSLTIPLSLLATLGVLNLFGITFNTFAVLGLIVALGLLVDNAIVVMENIDRYAKMGYKPKEASIFGTNQVGYPVASSTMTTLAAFFPLAILPGILGAFVSTIPITIMITVSASLVVSLVVTPSLSSRILRIKKGIHLPKFLNVLLSVAIAAGLSFIAFNDVGSQTLQYSMVALFTILMLLKSVFVGEGGLEETGLTNGYSRIIGWVATKRYRGLLVLLIGFLAVAFSARALTTGRLKIAFFPDTEPLSLTMTIDTPGGVTLDETNQLVKEVETALYEIEGISQFNTAVGGTEVDSATIRMEVDTSKVSGFVTRNQVQASVDKIPGASFQIEGVAMGPPVGKPIELRILGDDLYLSNDFAERLYDGLQTIDGVYNVDSSVSVGVPQIILDLAQYKTRAYGMTPIMVINHLRGELNGVVSSSLRRDGEDIDIVIRRDISNINQVEEVSNLFIPTQSGEMLTLQSFATLSLQGGISNITRKDGERVITLTADLVEGRNVNDVVDELRAMFPEDQVPEGVVLKYSGDVEDIEQNFGNLFQSMILAVFLVFIILTLQFKSISQPFIILTTLPMAFVGVVWGLVITGNEFGFYAFMGLVALIGIAVNDAIVLIDYINYLRKKGSSVVEAVMEAGKTRFNPVLATTLTTISGVLPLAFKETYYAQFSYALIFGLMVTTILTLVFIPTIYSIFTSRKEAAE